MTKKQSDIILAKIEAVQNMRQDSEAWLVAVSELRGMILVLTEEVVK